MKIRNLVCSIAIILLPVFGSHAQTITTYAGCCTGGGPVGDGGPATAAKLFDPVGGTFDKYGNYYFVESLSSSANRIRKVDPSGVITTIGGTGVAGFSGDNGSATIAKIHTPTSVKLDTAGNVFIADAANNRIRRIDHITGIITTICGNGTASSRGNGFPATAATTNNPQDICFDKYGNLYIAEYAARVRRIDPSGIIHSFAGNGVPGYSGDGSLADTTKLGALGGLATDTSGAIYIADASNSRIFKVNTSGIITTYAGTDTGYLFNGDGIPATSANIHPVKIGLDHSGNLFIAEHLNYRVRMVDASGIIHTAAGIGTPGFSGDNGPATAAQFLYPTGIAFDDCGNLYVPEANNNRVRRIDYSANPTITLTGSTSVVLGGTVTVTATIFNAGSGYTIQWYNHGVLFSTTTVPVTTYIKTAGTDSITATIYGCGSSAPSVQHIVTVAIDHTGISNTTPGTGDIKLWPNPVTGILHISNAPPGSSYVICEMTGRAVATGVLNKKDDEIDMAHIAKGIYLLQVQQADGQRAVFKVVKE